jgi:hypothetical protein
MVKQSTNRRCLEESMSCEEIVVIVEDLKAEAERATNILNNLGAWRGDLLLSRTDAELKELADESPAAVEALTNRNHGAILPAGLTADLRSLAQPRTAPARYASGRGF